MLDTANPTIEELRDDLAAAFRLAAHFELHEGICNHFSVEVSREPERYLINPYGTHWSMMRPEDLLLIDGDYNVLEGDGEVERSAFYIHRAGHRANPRHKCILHTHMPYATCLTMVEGGKLEMAHQTAIKFWSRMAWEPAYGGVAHDESAGEHVAGKQAENPHVDVIFLAAHGVVVGGPTVAMAFDDLYYLERACKQQVLAQSTGLPLKILDDDICRDTYRQMCQDQMHFAAEHLKGLKKAYLKPL